ncbi:DUF1905 domain-containing protein [Algoriphagus sp. Y33]|uniref:DUF1905 domain-containing protein n=1 Tax=Algoriphagus sp. Y33 TaxID=2772483 RepID=UPI001787410D|nr:DUF1905 domain-containing protein [Algoriphagus sp. Y33]
MQLVVEGEFLLERFQGKGGWTFVKFPKEIMPSSKAFGMMKVYGQVDGFSIDGKHLMPMGNGFVFLPIAKPIRTKIGKEEGDIVLIRLFQEEIPDKIPQELIDCLKDDPGKLKLFEMLSTPDQKNWVNYIYSVDDIDARSTRIIKLLNSLGS